MKYCRTTTLNHPVSVAHPNCIEDINTLIVREGCSRAVPLFTNSEIVINLDFAEELIANASGRLLNKSMDMGFGIKNSSSTKINMLMVELKFDVKDFYHLRRKDLEEKVAGSSLILGNIPPIYKLYIFIVKSDKIQEAINRLFRMVPKIDSNYVAMDIYQLKDRFF